MTYGYRYGAKTYQGPAPEDDEPFIALYWQYHSTYAQAFETAREALGFLVYGADNGDLAPEAIVRHATHQIVWCRDFEDVVDAYEHSDRYDAIDVM